MRLLLLCLFCFSLAGTAQAAVTISEIAWMGSAVSANDEWIELHNDGSASVSVEGWRLSDGMNLEIQLLGSIPAGGYAVLERTDDASAVGAAFLIYTGALTNGGATLSLYAADGSLADRIVGGENWEHVGGDNVTKETAQYTPLGWVTAAGTPGSALTVQQNNDDTEGAQDTQDDDTSETVQSTTEKSLAVQTLHLTPRTPALSIGGEKQMYVNQTVTFAAKPSGLADGLLNSLSHRWNFGDTYTAVGKEVSHHFRHPGEYMVTLRSVYKDYEATTQMRVVVLPVTFSLGTNSSGDLLVHNDARYEIDISRYRLEGAQSFRFPVGSVILPGATITIPKERILVRHGTPVVFSDTRGNEVARLGTKSDTNIPMAQRTEIAPPVVYAPTLSTPAAAFTFSQDMPTTTVSGSDEGAQKQVQVAAAIEAGDSIPRAAWPYLALVSMVGLGVLAIFASGVRDQA